MRKVVIKALGFRTRPMKLCWILGLNGNNFFSSSLTCLSIEIRDIWIFSDLPDLAIY